jgi:Family of unknown function (DUF5522)
MSMTKSPPTIDFNSRLIEGEDYYWEGEAMVFTEHYHLRRGYCCESGCRHCPYGEARANTSKMLKQRAE